MYRSQVDPGPLLVVASRSAVQGLDRSTGATVWECELTTAPDTHRSAVPRVVVQGEHVVFCSADPAPGGLFAGPRAVVHVTCLDYRTGRQRWQQHLDAERPASTCVGTLLVDASQVVLALFPLVRAYALDNGTLQWQREDFADLLALAVPGVAVQVDLQG